MRRTILILMSIFTFAALSPSCSEEEPAKTKKKEKGSGSDGGSSSDDDDDDDDSGSSSGGSSSGGSSSSGSSSSSGGGTGGGTDCTATAASGDGTGSTSGSGTTETTSGDGGSGGSSGSAGSAEGAGLALTEGPAFDTVSPFLSTNCAFSGCHDKTSAFGDYSSAAGVIPKAAKIIERIEKKPDEQGFMPQGKTEPLSAEEIKKFKAWVDGGKQGNGELPGGSSPCGGGTGGTTGDTTATDDDDDAAPMEPDTTPSEGGDKALETVLNPPKKEECHAAKKPFDRALNGGQGGCPDGQTLPLEPKCTKDAVMASYDNSPDLKTKVFDKFEADGKKLEDCGVDATTLYLYFYCLSDQAGKDPPNCKDPATLTGKTFYPKTSVAKVPIN